VEDVIVEKWPGRVVRRQDGKEKGIMEGKRRGGNI